MTAFKGICPVCRASYGGARREQFPHFPFCSRRCRLIDLGRWLDGDYRVSSPIVSDADELDDPDLPSAASGDSAE